jgi:hypothetical protein
MGSAISLVFLFLVVLFLALAFVIAVRLIGWGLSEREKEWPANWRETVEEVGPEGVPRAETEREAGTHRVA